MSRPLVLPWAVLVPDNARHGLVRDRIRLTARYRDSLVAASALARRHWRGDPLTSAVQLDVTLYEPDRRRRDVLNYGKLIADALAGAAYVDDSQIDRVTFLRGGIDRANPRAEVIVALLHQEP